MSAPLSAWSRRRAAVAAEAAAEEQASQDALIAAEQAQLAEKSDEEILEELGLPDPDTLVQGDDFKAFLAKTVPAHIRQRALRKLWRSNPVLACVDGLNDYDDDYLTGSVGQGPLKTTYQVGKGMLAHLVEMERQASLLLSPVGKNEAPQDVSDEEALVATAELSEDPTIAHTADPQTEVDDTPPHRTRRMQFHFLEDTA